VRTCRLLLGLLALAAIAVPASSSSALTLAADQTCVLALTRFDPAVVNVAYPDDSAQYWSGVYQAVPGTRIRIQGQFPHARYMSFNVYDAAQRPLDAIADFQIVPDALSSNPFVAGASRTLSPRRYTAYVSFHARPDTPAPNRLYTGTGQNGLPNTSGTLIYRIYIPDTGRDEFGDAGLPTVALQTATGGSVPESVCSEFSKPMLPGVNEQIAAMDGPFGTSARALFDRDPPVWRKFTNLFQAVADSLTDSDLADPLFEAQRSLNLDEVGGSGGFLSNKHNAYLSAGINKAFGPVVVTRLRAPGFADTRAGAPTMPSADLRYWSICENDPPTQRFIACRNDDRSVVGADGFATFVISTPSERPANATDSCGVNWLPWGPDARGIVIYRHMLPAASFTQSIQAATFEHEADTMGDYFPTSHYVDKAGFEALGCPAA
jgi:hypothetical protein